jgi:hypothetical protein
MGGFSALRLSISAPAMYPGVVFPTGWIADGPGTVQMYNGAADTPPLAAAVLGLLRALVPSGPSLK